VKARKKKTNPQNQGHKSERRMTREVRGENKGVREYR
jgi:hypothetical protein